MAKTRKKIRDKYGLKAEPCDDCCVMLCLQCCANAQMMRELKSRNAKTGGAPEGATMIR